MIDAPVPCPSAYVVDGDSLRCGSVRVRLLGIDAPELTVARLAASSLPVTVKPYAVALPMLSVSGELAIGS